MLHPTTISRRALLSAATKPSTTTTTMPYRLRTTCPRATRIATIRASTASTAAMNSSTTTTTTTSTTTPSTTPSTTRSLHFSRTLLGSTKEDHMERDRLNPTSTEYSKTGSDDAAAHMDDAAFNPDKTSPEEALGSAERESGEVRHQQQQQSSSQEPSPLNVSPGNRDVSATKDPKQSGPDRSPSESGEASSRARTSSRGSPAKHGSGKTGGGGVHGSQ